MAGQGKVALVTGGGSGIGRSAALALQGDGWNVVVAGRRKEELDKTVAMAKAGGGMFAQGVAERAWGAALGNLTPPRWDEAETHLAVSLECFETGDNRLEAARTHVTWGLISRNRGNTNAAREHFEKAAAQFESAELARELQQVRAIMTTLG